jgi:hypothetical protein
VRGGGGAPPQDRSSVPPKRYVSRIALVSSIHETSSCLGEERCDTLMEDDVEIDSRFVADGSIVEYKGKVIDSPR